MQMPLYPMLSSRTFGSSAGNDAPVWNTRSNETAWDLYLAGKEPDQYASPSLAEDYSELPPTITFVGTIEPFYDETVRYVENLRAAGVKTAFKVYKGCYHGFDIVAPYAEVSRDARRFLREHFAYGAAHFFAAQPEEYER